LEGCQSQLQREKTLAWFRKDVSFAGQSGESHKLNITFVGTVLHEDSLLANLLKTPTAHLRSKYRSIVSWATRQDLWEEWRKIYTQLENLKAADDAKAYYQANEPAMLEGTEVLWPDGESYYELMVQQLSMGKAAFSSEKQNEPFDPDSQILDPDLCPRFKVYFPHDPEWLSNLGDEGFAIVRSDNGKAIHSRDLKIIAFLDPALGRKTKNGIPVGDYAACVVCAQDHWGYIYTLDVWLKKAKPDAQIKAAFALHEKWRFDILYLETIGFQELLKDKMVIEQKNWKTPMRIVGVDVHSEGKARIISMEPYFANGWLLMNENVDPEFLQQIRLFPTVHDDGPDSLHGCVSRLKKPQGYIGTAPRIGESSSV
jgi:predicted phage terminase large subunit-like protein